MTDRKLSNNVESFVTNIAMPKGAQEAENLPYGDFEALKEGSTLDEKIAANISYELLVHGLDAPFLQQDQVHSLTMHFYPVPRHELTFQEVRRMYKTSMRGESGWVNALSSVADEMNRRGGKIDANMKPFLNVSQKERKIVSVLFLTGMPISIFLLVALGVGSASALLLSTAFAAGAGIVGLLKHQHYLRRKASSIPKLEWLLNLKDMPVLDDVPVFAPQKDIQRYLNNEITLEELQLLSRENAITNDSASLMAEKDSLELESRLQNIKCDDDQSQSTIKEIITQYSEESAKNAQTTRSAKGETS